MSVHHRISNVFFKIHGGAAHGHSKSAVTSALLKRGAAVRKRLANHSGVIYRVVVILAEMNGASAQYHKLRVQKRYVVRQCVAEHLPRHMYLMHAGGIARPRRLYYVLEKNFTQRLVYPNVSADLLQPPDISEDCAGGSVAVDAAPFSAEAALTGGHDRRVGQSRFIVIGGAHDNVVVCMPKLELTKATRL